MGFEPTVAGQVQALEYVDSHLPELLELLPDRCDLMILADHGECFGEEGLWGHSFYHPKVMEVPFAYIQGFKDPDRSKQA
jgi:glucan phosphoethanolaminetransferase (alkaline phosphatase superfamily)